MAKRQSRIQNAYTLLATLILPVIFWANVAANIKTYGPVKLVILTVITSGITFLYILWLESATRKYVRRTKKRTYKPAILILLQTILR